MMRVELTLDIIGGAVSFSSSVVSKSYMVLAKCLGFLGRSLNLQDFIFLYTECKL